ncbi:MAG: nicotinate (nicotinamide) nucleotide adenylyltransferase [Lachnospiraceae bacterium]|jgi:nicotinate-nucleotide adenylyltransferase|nr:nicotinate (nicotinamide) nucleotide adenylyltransferase [Lachnospiraceae bacterium]
MIKNESCFPAEEAGRKKVGILGGTFDPIHTGHLILAETACEAFSLDYVLIMPNGNPPHKPGQVNASMEQRTRMAELAASDNDHFRVSDFEKTPQDYHYTYETLEFLTQEHPDTDYYFILGADSLVHFHTWKEPERICKCCRILAATRDRMETSVLKKHMERLALEMGACIEPLETPNIDISSNMLRERVRKGRSIRYYVPDTVEAYIREQGLYL